MRSKSLKKRNYNYKFIFDLYASFIYIRKVQEG